MSTVNRIRVVLGLKRSNYPDLLVKGTGVYNGFSGNPAIFADPNPTLPILGARLQAFSQAQQTALNRAKGSAAVRDQKAGDLVTSLETARAYVQERCDESPEQALAIIIAAGMKAAETPSFNKPVLQAKQRKPGSPIEIVANVGVLTADAKGRVFFGWQHSADGGATWISLLPTPHGNTTIANLAPGATYSVRANVTDATGPGPWCQAVTFVVR